MTRTTENFDWIETELNARGLAPRPPGVYFGLDEDEYHADPSLGSTSIKKLLETPADYWWESQLNPMRPEKNDDTDAMIVGRAMHAYILEGEEAFNSRYMRGPDNSSSDLSPSDKGNRTKAAKKVAAERGVDLIKFDDHNRITLIGKRIESDPKLAPIFRNGETEVSVFWRSNGVPCKARLDCLKINGVGDLKSTTNTMGKHFERACIDQFSTLRYDMQAAHYLEGRNIWLPRFVAEGSVFGDHDADWLERVAAVKQSAFQWVFASKTHAPNVFSFFFTAENDLLKFARMHVDQALDNYRSCMDAYGLEAAWIAPAQPRELTVEDLPNWHGLKAQTYSR